MPTVSIFLMETGDKEGGTIYITYFRKGDLVLISESRCHQPKRIKSELHDMGKLAYHEHVIDMLRHPIIETQET